MMIWPAGFLVLIVIAAIGADLSRIYMARMSLDDLAASIANDVAAGAIDVQALRLGADTETYQLDRNLAEALGNRLIEARGDPALTDVAWEGLELEDLPDGSQRLTVTVSGNAHYIFGRALPGGDQPRRLVATAEVTLIDEE
jgi:hypothetical protein